MATTLKYDMPGPAPVTGTGDSIIVVAGDTRRLTDSAGLFTSDMVGKKLVISGALDPLHDGGFLVTAYESATQITYENGAAVTENPFSGNWAVTLLDIKTCPLAYDAVEVEDDALMLSGPHTGAGGSTPPGSWPNPGADDRWDGPYGPELVDWTNVSHPGADMTQGGWVPPNKGLKYDSSVPTGWYTRISKRDKYSRWEQDVPTINNP